MVSEILKERLKNSVGSEVELFLHNGFRFKGKVTNCDEEYIEILDYHSCKYKLIEMIHIREASIENKEEGK